MIFVPTIPQLDSILEPRPGLPTGCVTLIAGPTGVGRSRFAARLARGAALAEHPTLFLDCEGCIQGSQPFAVRSPKTMQEAFDILHAAAGRFDLIMVDGFQFLPLPSFDQVAAGYIQKNIQALRLGVSALAFTWQTRKEPVPGEEVPTPFDKDMILTLSHTVEKGDARVQVTKAPYDTAGHEFVWSFGD